MTEQEMHEKVIAGLECCKGECLEPSEGKCPYYPDTHGDRCFHMLISDALELLKAQEPVEPYTKRDGGTTFFFCSGCNKPLCIAKDSYKPKHCPECGRAVKWK